MTSIERIQDAIDTINEFIEEGSAGYGCAYVVVDELTDILIEMKKDEN